MPIDKFLLGIWAAIQRIFKRFPKPLKAAIHTGVIITEQLRNFTDSGVADILTAIIPGDVDDRIKFTLRTELPRIVENLKLAENCANQKDVNAIMKCAISTLQNISKDFEMAFLHSISIMIAQALSDGKLTWSDGVFVIEWYYKHVHKNKNEYQIS